MIVCDSRASIRHQDATVGEHDQRADLSISKLAPSN
jgi:hypothetical protein